MILYGIGIVLIIGVLVLYLMKDDWSFKKYENQVKDIREIYQSQRETMSKLHADIFALRTHIDKQKESADFLMMEISKLRNKADLLELIQKNQKLTVKIEGPVGVVHRPYKPAVKEKMNGKSRLIDRAGLT
jgi:regulator of replication initiation timing